MSSWSAGDIPDQDGRVIVLTGANSGIGFEAAKALTARGAHVVFACRTLAKADAARADLAGSHESRHLDLLDLDSVRDFARDWGTAPIDVLINNAGIMNVPLTRSPQGHESQLATNVLGHFLLTNLLLPHVQGRVVTLASLAHKIGRIDLADPNFTRRRYNGWIAYGQSKLADLMFAYELQRRLTDAHSRVRSMAAHPGYAATNLQSHGDPVTSAVLRLANVLPWVAQPAYSGAHPTLYAATVPDLPGGSYIGPDGFLEAQGSPRPVDSSAASKDVAAAGALWALCEELTGQPFRVGV